MGKRKDFAWTAGKRIFAVLAILLGITIAIIEYAENAKEPLRLGLQDYLTQMADGNPAEITNLKKSELFPQIDFEATGIIIRDKENKERALVSADSAHISMGFWGAFFGMADYRIFSIENMVFATGFLLPQKLDLGYIGISDPDPETSPPYFIAEGRYNDRDLLATAEMRRDGQGRKIHYDFAGEIPVSFKLGSTEMNARFLRKIGGIGFTQIVLVSGGNKAILVSKDLSLKPLNIDFDGEMGGFPFMASLLETDGLYTVSIIPGADDPQFIKELRNISQSVLTDLGIPKEGGQIKVEINAPYVAQTENKSN